MIKVGTFAPLQAWQDFIEMSRLYFLELFLHVLATHEAKNEQPVDILPNNFVNRPSFKNLYKNQRWFISLIKYMYNLEYPEAADFCCFCLTHRTDCMNLGTRVVTPSFKPASLNPKTASCTLF